MIFEEEFIFHPRKKLAKSFQLSECAIIKNYIGRWFSLSPVFVPRLYRSRDQKKSKKKSFKYSTSSSSSPMGLPRCSKRQCSTFNVSDKSLVIWRESQLHFFPSYKLLTMWIVSPPMYLKASFANNIAVDGYACCCCWSANKGEAGCEVHGEQTGNY